MEWQFRLIKVYLKVCDLWDQGIWTSCQRFSSNQSKSLTDQEAATIFIFGVMQGKMTIKEIHSFTKDFLAPWFPGLKSYEAFNHQLHQISDSFATLVEKLIESFQDKGFKKEKFRILLDSFPISLAKNTRSSHAKVARELADKGYCASKKMYYYGVKLHIASTAQEKSLPKPSIVGVTQASCHDLKAFSALAENLDYCEVFADKAYANKSLQKQLRLNQKTDLMTPIKRKKNQTLIDSADRLYSRAVSRIRQPIESLFNWLQEKTKIQVASKVRSTKGLLIHVFGRLSAGLMMMKV